MTGFVQPYKSTDANGPGSMSGVAGRAIAIFDACLVNGYTPASVTSITRSGTTATVVLAVANNTLESGQYFRIVGATPSTYNGDQQITVIDPTQFTFQVAGTPATPATGTITYAKAPLGWEKVYSGTNLAVYRSYNILSNRFYLRVDEATTANLIYMRGYETMSDVNTGTGAFPTVSQSASGLAQRKCQTPGDATARAWGLIGDDKTFYYNVAALFFTYDYYMSAFGHFISHRPGDGFNTFLSGAVTLIAGTTSPFNYFGGSPPYQSTWPVGTSVSSVMLARNYTQVGSGWGAMIVPPFGSNTNLTSASGAFGASVQGGNWITYPNAPDFGYLVAPIYVAEFTAGQYLRGRLPGVFAPLVNPSPAPYDTFEGVMLPGGGTMKTISFPAYYAQSAAGHVAFDLVGPWI